MTKDQKPKFSKYIAPQDNLSNKDITRAEWFLRHKIVLKWIFLGTIIAISAGLNIFGLIGWGKYIIFGTLEDQQLWRDTVQSVVNYIPLQAQYKPQALEFERVGVTQPANGRYDFSVDVTNLNKRKMAEVDLYFTYADGETRQETAVIMPDTSRPIVIFGHEGQRFPTGVRLEVADVRWKTINPHDLFDIQTYIAMRKQFDFIDFTFLAKNDAADRPAHSVTFTARNNSNYSFWDVPILIELKRGNTRVGFLQTSLKEFVAGEERPVDLRSVAPGLSVTGMTAHPIVNYFDEGVFMPPQIN